MNTSRYNGAFTCSAIAIVIAVLAVLMSMPAILSAALTSSPRDADAKDAFAALMAEHNDAVEEDQNRFIGRSVFFAPPRKRAFTAPRPSRDPKPATIREPEPLTPRIPTTWTGPDIIAIVIDTLWFSDGKRIKVGNVKDGIGVINIDNAPYSAVCSYKGWEGDVEFVERSLTFGDEKGLPDSADLEGGIIQGETEEERLARLEEFNRQARVDAENARPDRSAASSRRPGRNTARPRGGAREISEEQRRKNREADPKPTVPDE